MKESRYIKASETVVTQVAGIINDFFPELEGVKIEPLFDTKMRKKGDKIVLGQVKKATDLIRKLTDHTFEGGCDYILFIDQVVYEVSSEVDRIRLIRHELRHCKVTVNENSGEKKFGVVPHDIEDFQIEIELNKEDIGWARRVATLAAEIYDARKENKEEAQKREGTEGKKEQKPRFREKADEQK